MIVDEKIQNCINQEYSHISN